MAVDVCSEISSVVIISPRISFSHDLDADPDIEAARKHINESKAAAAAAESDFFFSIISPSQCPHEPCSADEIFSNGKILPTQIKKKNLFLTHHRNSAPAQLGVGPEAKKIRLKELLECEDEDGEERKPVGGTKSFWQFRRSSSLNFESGTAKALIRSIQFLSRSKSTGSVPSQKQSRLSRTGQKQNCQKQQSGHNHSDKAQFYYYVNGGSTSTSSSASGQKPPLSRARSYGSGNVRISPVLNIPLPPSYFCRGNAASLLRFGSSLFCNGKDKSKKKKRHTEA